MRAASRSLSFTPRGIMCEHRMDPKHVTLPIWTEVHCLAFAGPRGQLVADHAGGTGFGHRVLTAVKRG